MPRSGKPIWERVLLIALVVFGIAGCSSPEEGCLGTEPHPIGVNIATNYDVDYAQVMAWYCEDYAFDDIILALETASLKPEYDAETLLEMRTSAPSWDDVWQGIGLTED